MSDKRRDDDTTETEPEAAGLGYGGARRGYGYGGHGPADDAQGRGTSVYDAGELEGLGRGGDADETDRAVSREAEEEGVAWHNPDPAAKPRPEDRAEDAETVRDVHDELRDRAGRP